MGTLLFDPGDSCGLVGGGVPEGVGGPLGGGVGVPGGVGTWPGVGGPDGGIVGAATGWPGVGACVAAPSQGCEVSGLGM